ncbi:uncharacterized protein LOC135475394 isoform X2 [Liolophura sinensis]
MVKYTVRNQLKNPKFVLTQNVPLLEGEVFQRIMEKAATEDPRFRFTAYYCGEDLGYQIMTINNLTADYERDRTWWSFLQAPDTLLDKGVSYYQPSAGEHLILDFTQGGSIVADDFHGV